MGKNSKYIYDLKSPKVEETEEKREERIKKHNQNRIIAWIALCFIVAVLSFFLYKGVAAGFRAIKAKLPKEEAPATSVTTSVDDIVSELDDALESIIGMEPEVEVPEPEVDPGPTEEELFEEAVREYVAAMEINDKVAGMFIVTPEELTGVKTVTKAGEGTKKALEEYAVGGIIYSAKNMQSPEQFKEVIDNTKEYTKYPLFLAVDEELGKTSFSKAMKVAETLTAAEIGETGDPSIAYLEEEKIAKYMSEYGLNLNLGIIADVLTDEENKLMEGRIFGSNPDTVSELAGKCVQALNVYGISSSVKFFPGQASASGDTSEGLASLTRTKEDFRGCEFLSFKSTVDQGASMIMVGHASAPNLTGDNIQCSQSKTVMTDILRIELGIEKAIVITDSLSKAAISAYFESGDAAVAAIKAGADMVLSPEEFPKAYEAVCKAVEDGIISEERIDDSLLRIYCVKFKDKTAEEVKALLVTE